MDRQTIKEAVTRIEMPADMEQRMVRACRRATQPARRHLPLRAVALIAALALCMTALPALATVPAAYRALYALSPALAQRLKPVALSCEDQGIAVEVIAADVTGDTAQIYISLTDVEGDRLDGSIDLFDSYHINTPFDCSATCTQVSYDEAGRTATFFISIVNQNGQPIEGDKLTLSLERLLTGKREFNGPITGIALADVTDAPIAAIPGEHIRGYGGSIVPGEHKAHVADMLAQGMLSSAGTLCSPTDGVAVTGIGFAGEYLHVQLWFEDIHSTDNHGSVYFIDRATGERIDCVWSTSYWDGDTHNSYDELLFNIAPEQLAQLDMYGDFTTCDTLIEGGWEITFPLEDMENE